MRTNQLEQLPYEEGEGIKALTKEPEVTNKWIDEKEKLGDAVEQFLDEASTKKHDYFTEFHTSGSDPTPTNHIPSLVMVLYEKGIPVQVHIRTEGSTNDSYLYKRAIDDLGRIFMDLEKAN